MFPIGSFCILSRHIFLQHRVIVWFQMGKPGIDRFLFVLADYLPPTVYRRNRVNSELSGQRSSWNILVVYSLIKIKFIHLGRRTRFSEELLQSCIDWFIAAFSHPHTMTVVRTKSTVIACHAEKKSPTEACCRLFQFDSDVFKNYFLAVVPEQQVQRASWNVNTNLS